LCAPAGFGTGPLFFVPTFNYLLAHFATLPTFVGAADAVETLTQNNALFARVGSELVQVVQVGDSTRLT
jgi:hypothetical protein